MAMSMRECYKRAPTGARSIAGYVLDMNTAIPMNALRDGQSMPVRVDGTEVLLCRVDGAFFAVGNYCTHARQALHTGRLRGYEVTCPLHGARFDVRDGRCVKGPAVQAVPTYRVFVEGGKVNVSVGGNRGKGPP